MSPAPYDENGVDLTLIRSFLSLTPAERLAEFQDFMGFAEEIWRRNGIEPYFRDSEDAA